MPTISKSFGVVDCAWGNDVACNSYMQVTRACDFHCYCNLYGTMKLLGNVQNLRVLDLPSGPGIYACKLLQKGAALVTSVDIDPNVIAHCEKAVADAAKINRKPVSLFDESSRYSWCGITANGAIAKVYPGAPFDVVRANFLLENFSSKDDMLACAHNIYNNLKPGARYVGLWAPGAHTAVQRRIVREAVGMSTSRREGMCLGDVCKISYSRVGNDKVFEWYLRSEDELRDCLHAAGFVDITFKKLLVDPDYPGEQDLHKFVENVGNRHILATKPLL